MDEESLEMLGRRVARAACRCLLAREARACAENS